MTSCKSHESWKLPVVFVHWCYQHVTMGYYLSPLHPPPPLHTHTYRDNSLCFKKIRTTTTPFLTSKTVVPNPYSHSNFCNHILTLSSFEQICLSLIFNTLHLQIGNVILQCLNRNWTAIFKNRFVVNGQYIWFTTLLLISIYQKW